MIHRIFKRIAPLAALAGASVLSGCGGMDIQFGDDDGVPLAELDTSSAAPTEIVLAGPDDVVISEGADFNVAVSGDAEAVESLRFSLEEDALSISREKDMGKVRGRATVQVTMPRLNEIVLAGSGQVQAARMTGKAEIVVAGSGSVAVDKIEAQAFALTIAGSGDFAGSGTADTLDLTIAGSGEADMPGLKVGGADITVAGSGSSEFASDGQVEASIMGSGSIVVNGRADCSVEAMGSGKLTCRSVRPAEGNTAQTPATPVVAGPPDAPEAPAAPAA